VPDDADNRLQVLDGATLGAIWSGSVVWWNDTAIQTLNPSLTLPQERILLTYASDTSSGITQTFTRALSLFDTDFAAAWNATGSLGWAGIAGIAGHANNSGRPGQAQTDYVKVCPLCAD
jgi:ABC-type phosphate transport system substrate-binding protein